MAQKCGLAPRVAVTNARGYTTTAVFDALNRQVATVDALSNRATSVFDAAGQLVATVDQLNNRTTLGYDSRGRRVSVTDPLSHSATTVYDAADNATAQVDALGNRTTSVFDALNRAVAEVDPRGYRTTSTFDAVGNRTTLKDAVGNVTTWVYDSLNRVTTETDPLGNSATFAYDAAGRKASETDRLGRRRDFAFDAAGRVEAEKWYAAGGALSQTQTFTYDAADRMLTAQDPDGTYTLAYDNAGRVSSVQEPFSLVLTMAHDAAGNRTLVQDSKGGVTTVTFDALDRQSSERVGGSGVSAARFDYGYTARSEVASVTRYSDLAGTAVVGTTTHDYDAAGRQTHLKHTSGAGATLAEYTYTYDAADRLTEKVESGTSTTYAYDSADQLTVDGASGFSYDGTGNRTNAGYATGAGNRLSTDGVRTYTHDANGNVTQSTVGGAGATWVYSYDHRNQLVGASYSATPGGTVTQLVTYSYDAFGVRIQRQYWDGSTTTTTRYGVDGWDPAKPGAIGNESYDSWVEIDGTGAVVTRYAWGTGFHEVVALQDGGGAVEWALTDHQKSVRKVIDNSASVVGTTDYTAFGAPAGPVAITFGFTGYAWNPVTQLWEAPGRIYDPWTGRFMQVDSLGFAAGDPNLFRYVGNSPTNSTDPSGLDSLINDGQHIAWRVDKGPATSVWGGYQYWIGRRTEDPGQVQVNVGDTWHTVSRAELQTFIGSRFLGQQWGEAAGGRVIGEQIAIFVAEQRAKARAAAQRAPDNGKGPNTPPEARGKTSSAILRQDADQRPGQAPPAQASRLDGVLQGLSDTGKQASTFASMVFPVAPNPSMAVFDGSWWHLLPGYTVYKLSKDMSVSVPAQYEGYRSADMNIFFSVNNTIAVHYPATAWYVNLLEMYEGKNLHGVGYGQPLSEFDCGERSVAFLRNLALAGGPSALSGKPGGAPPGPRQPGPPSNGSSLAGSPAGKSAPRATSPPAENPAPNVTPAPEGTTYPTPLSMPVLPPKGPATATETEGKATEKKPCFAGETPLRTPGGWRKFEDLRVGDLVLSRDEHDQSGDVFAKVVEELFVGQGLVWHLHAGGQVIRTTAEHPFFVWDRGWTPCNQLRVGDWLVTMDGLCVQVEDVLDTGEWETLYNVRIADFHTYFVGCDEWGFSVWAHNACVRIYRWATPGIPGPGHESIEIIPDKGEPVHTHQEGHMQAGPDGSFINGIPTPSWIEYWPKNNTDPLKTSGTAEITPLQATTAIAYMRWRVIQSMITVQHPLYNLRYRSCETYVWDVFHWAGIPGLNCVRPVEGMEYLPLKKAALGLHEALDTWLQQHKDK